MPSPTPQKSHADAVLFRSLARGDVGIFFWSLAGGGNGVIFLRWSLRGAASDGGARSDAGQLSYAASERTFGVVGSLLSWSSCFFESRYITD